MTRENKAGLVVCGSFLCLIAAVVVVKLRQPGGSDCAADQSDGVHRRRAAVHGDQDRAAREATGTLAGPRHESPGGRRLRRPAYPAPGPRRPAGPARAERGFSHPAGTECDAGASRRRACRTRPRRLGRSP